MIKQCANPFHKARLCGLVFIAAIAAGCAHHVDPATELHRQVAPFTQTRDQTIALVKEAKHSMDPASLNDLNVAYASLEGKANGYAGFLVEAASVASFDATKNNDYAAKLTKAIESFNSSYATINPQQASASKLSSTWIPPFADSVKSYWDRYHTTIATASPQMKSTLMQQLKSDTVWPNFEDIAPQPLSPTPSPRN